MRSAYRSTDKLEAPRFNKGEGPIPIEAAMEAATAALHSNESRAQRILTGLSDGDQPSKRQSRDKPAAYLQPQSPDVMPWAVPLTDVGEHYEVLKANVWVRCSELGMKTVVFVGASAGSGVSTAAACFAEALANDVGSAVLLIDANLRSALGHPVSHAAEEMGTSFWALITGAKGPLIPVPGPGNLYVLPSGPPFPRPSLLFQTAAFEEFLENARERFDYIVFDAPPVRGHPESLVLSRWADGVVLVIESEKTRKRSALWAKQQIEAAGGNLLGVVLNKRRFYIPDWMYRLL